MRRGTPAGVGSMLLVACLGSACGPGPGSEPQAASSDRDVGPIPWFEEVAASSGLDFEYHSGHNGRYLFPEIMGGGVALFDMDLDNDLDMYLVQGGSLTLGKEATHGNRLYRNRGDGRFEDVTASSAAGDQGYGMGVTVGDYDNDGDPDIYVTNVGPNVLLRNDGGGHFTDVSAEAGVADKGWGASSAFLDHDGDGDLDLFVVNYVNWSARTELDCFNPAGLLDYCLPTNYEAPGVDRLYRNEGDGRFRDVTGITGLEGAFGNGLGVVTADFDDNGAPDLFVANDMMLNQLWLSDGAGGFVEEAMVRGCAVDEKGAVKAGMGVGVGDVDRDGDADLLVVNLRGQSDSFFRNDNGYFSDETGMVGLAGASRPFTRFGVGFADFDNDGYSDLYQANGDVVMSPEAMTDDPYAQPNLLLRGSLDGVFREVEPRGGTSELLIATSRGAAFGDVDNDGGLDVVVVNRDAPVHLLRNVVPDRGHWLSLRVIDEHGHDALGAVVTVTAGDEVFMGEVRTAYSYSSSSDPRVHIGLGQIREIEHVTVDWPAGGRERFLSIPVDSTSVLERGAGVDASD